MKYQQVQEVGTGSVWKVVSGKDRVIVISVVLAVTLLKIAFVWNTDIRRIAGGTYLIDDSFIIMRVARNLALGHGFSFDGVNPTSGVPLLWTLLTSINHLLFGKVVAAKLVAIETSIIGALAGILVFSITNYVFGRRSAYIAFVLYMLSVPLLFQSMNGMETFPFVLLGLYTLSFYLSINIDTEAAGNSRSWIILGMLLGTLCLMKSDGIVMVFSICSYEFYKRKNRKYILHLLGACVFVLIPLFSWNLYASGSLAPASQQGRFALEHHLLPGKSELNELGWHGYLLASLYNVLYFARLHDIILGSFILSVVALVIAHSRKLFLGERGARELYFVCTIYLLCSYCLYTFYQWYIPDVHGLRYAVFGSVLLIMFLSSAISHLLPRMLQVILILYLLAIGLFQYHYKVGFTPYVPPPNPWFTRLNWINENIPKGATIGLKDSGIISYFGDYRVVDLAGILDPSVISAIKQKSMIPYLRKHKVEYILLPGEEAGRYYFSNKKYYLRAAFDLDDSTTYSYVGNNAYSVHLE